MGPGSSSNGEDFDRRLRTAEEKIHGAEEKRFTGTGNSRDSGDSPLLGLALRIGTDMVAGLAVGVAIGYGLDRWLGYRILFLVIFALLGFAAGMVNVWRIVNGPDMGSGPK